MFTKQNKGQEDLWEEDVMPLEDLVQKKPKRKRKNHSKKQLTEFGKSLLALFASSITLVVIFITLITMGRKYPVFQLLLFINFVLSCIVFLGSMINLVAEDEKISFFKDSKGSSVFFIAVLPLIIFVLKIPGFLSSAVWPKIFEDVE